MKIENVHYLIKNKANNHRNANCDGDSRQSHKHCNRTIGCHFPFQRISIAILISLHDFFNFNSIFCYDFFFTYTSSKLEVLNNNDYCSKSVASSLRFSIQFFKTQLKIPRNRCATFFKRLGDTYKHTLHFGRFCHKLSKKYQVK